MKSWNPVWYLRFLSGIFFALGFSVSAHAQIIYWAPATDISGDSDLITAGTELDAFLTNSGGIQSSDISLPDGLVFHLATNLSFTDTSATDGLGLSWQITSGNSHRYSWTSYSQPGASSAFDTLMDSGGVYSDGGSGTGIVTISNLTAGHTYTVQVFEWADDNDLGLLTLLGQNSVTLNDGGSASSSGQYSTGFFTATGPVETFDWAGAGSSYTPLGPISVQDLGDLSAPDVPEPSTYTLMFCGISVLFILNWFRGSARPR
jgi:hypothetical protein